MCEVYLCEPWNEEDIELGMNLRGRQEEEVELRILKPLGSHWNISSGVTEMWFMPSPAPIPQLEGNQLLSISTPMKLRWKSNCSASSYNGVPATVHFRVKESGISRLASNVQWIAVSVIQLKVAPNAFWVTLTYRPTHTSTQSHARQWPRLTCFGMNAQI